MIVVLKPCNTKETAETLENSYIYYKCKKYGNYYGKNKNKKQCQEGIQPKIHKEDCVK